VPDSPEAKTAIRVAEFVDEEVRDVAFENRGAARRVAIDISVDGRERAPLGVS
jgi:hypothetical protein